jgi:lycopene beta-cyclase
MSGSQENEECDLIIVGGGCAGLSLAARLASRDRNYRVVVVEARERYSEDRTWCGWRTEPHFFDDCRTHEWNDWQVVSRRGLIRRGSKRYPYELVNVGAFYEKAQRVIRESRAGRLILGARVEEVVDRECHATVRLDDGRRLRAPWVIDTRPQRRVLQQPWLWQSFVGYVVELQGACGKEESPIPTIMDFQPADAGMAQFTYVLPLGANRYLYEWARLSPTPGHFQSIEAKLAEWIERRVGSGWRIERREAGSLPMALPLQEKRMRVAAAGTRGGSMRASTGYAFHAIQRWAEPCCALLLEKGRPLEPMRNRMLDALDASFLSVLHQNRVPAEELFGQLFDKCGADHLVRFMSGIPQANDFWPVAQSLPWGPFLPTVPIAVSSWCRA